MHLCTVHKPATIIVFGSSREKGPVKLRPSGHEIDVELARFRLSLQEGISRHLLWIVSMCFIYRVLPFRSLRRFLSRKVPWIASIESCSLIGDIRGGDSFSDIYGFQRFFVASLATWSVILVRGSIVHFPQTYGPFKAAKTRWIARFLLRRSSVVVARDRDSLKVAQSLLGHHKDVRLSPDVAFALVPDTQISAPMPRFACGINVNGLMFNGGYSRANMFGLKLDYPKFLRELIPSLLERISGDIILIPHTLAPAGNVESDNEASRILRDELPEHLKRRVHLLDAEGLDCHQIKGAIGNCDFFVGSRMHACIGALSQSIPCVGVAYSMKFLGVFASVGVADSVVDARTHDVTSALDAVLVRWSDRAAVAQALKIRVAEAKSELKRIFASLEAEDNNK